MDVKKFIAKDAKSAIQKVRDCFGDEAIILSNKKVNNNIEIIAAKENKNSEVNSKTLDSIPLNAIPDTNIEKLILENQNISSKSENDPLLKKMHAEIKSFKQLLGHQLLSEKYKKDPVKASIYQYGKELSLSDIVIEKIYNNLKNQGLNSDITKIDLTKVYKDLIFELKNSIKVKKESILQKNKIISFVGTNGVGKTTLICKLAAYTVLSKGNKDIVILSSDTQKVGGGDGIVKMANILEIDNYFVNNKQDLFKIYELNRGKIILLDTPGFSLNETTDNNRSVNFSEFAIKMGLNENIVDNHLVIPVIYQNKVYKNLIQKFKVLDIKSAILTMFDSVTDLGFILSDLIQHDINLSYYSDGVKIPQSLHEISQNHLIETLLFLNNTSYNKIAD
tara:strand:+ start:1504 stop:2679 length:1176 start_codon:yes stop_codon:yes gene_type:complete